eukprot:3549236-Rhodomonas_salina.1
MDFFSGLDTFGKETRSDSQPQLSHSDAFLPVGVHFGMPGWTTPQKLGNLIADIPAPVALIGSILNRFLFPAPKSSYTWTSFPGELICIVGREGNIVPCTVSSPVLRIRYAMPSPDAACGGAADARHELPE